MAAQPAVATGAAAPPLQGQPKLPDGTAALLEQLSEQPNMVPDELVRHLMRKVGQDCKDERLLRLVSLAAQRFIAEAIFDTLQVCKSRLASAPKKQLKASGFWEKRVLTTEDLARVLKEFGVNVRQPQYLLDSTGGSEAQAGGAAAKGIPPAPQKK